MVRAAYLALLCYASTVQSFEPDFFSPPVLEYPVVTESMVSGVGEIDRKLAYKPLRSVAVIGADELSARWLRLNNTYLVSLRAVGLVVNVESVEQLGLLQQYTGILLIASPGYDFAEHFGPVYPFVIDASAGRVRQ